MAGVARQVVYINTNKTDKAQTGIVRKEECQSQRLPSRYESAIKKGKRFLYFLIPILTSSASTFIKTNPPMAFFFYRFLDVYNQVIFPKSVQFPQLLLLFLLFISLLFSFPWDEMITHFSCLMRSSWELAYFRLRISFLVSIIPVVVPVQWLK